MLTSTEGLRDVSLAHAARIIGCAALTLKQHWHEIDTAYVTLGGQHRVSLGGLERWQEQRHPESIPVRVAGGNDLGGSPASATTR